MADSLQRRSLPSLAVFLALTLVAEFVGRRLRSSSTSDWYRDVEKPPFNPPPWVFGPVWTTLYVAMAAAAWLGWKRGPKDRQVRLATVLFGVQLGLNVIWSGIFFAARSPLAAFIEIWALLASVVVWQWRSARLDGRTRWLVLTYVA